MKGKVLVTLKWTLSPIKVITVLQFNKLFARGRNVIPRDAFSVKACYLLYICPTNDGLRTKRVRVREGCERVSKRKEIQVEGKGEKTKGEERGRRGEESRWKSRDRGGGEESRWNSRDRGGEERK